jgi:hypothetical protein
MISFRDPSKNAAPTAPTRLFGPRPSVSSSIPSFRAPAAASTDEVQLSPSAPQSTVINSSPQVAQQLALPAVPGPLAAAFRHVWDALPEETRPQLVQLLDRGTLNDTFEGKNTLEHLRDLTGEKRASGLDGSLLTQQVVSTLVDPDTQIHQGETTYTCGATNLQRQLSHFPAKFTAIIEGLTDTQGKAGVLTRAEGSEEADKSGRNLLNRVFQGALMKLADEGYDPRTDALSDGSNGLRGPHLSEITTQLLGEPYSIVAHNGKTHHEFVKAFDQAENIQVAVSWKDSKGRDSDHLLLYLGRDGDQARYFDPATAQAGQMPVDKLLFKTQMAVFPHRLVATTQWPPEDVYHHPSSQ